jgi:hypothetical protein
MNENPTKSRAVSGVVAPAPRPTPLGAAVIAAMITFPIGMTLIVVDLLLL